MIGRKILAKARQQSNDVSTTDPVVTLQNCGIDVEALNELIVLTLAAYAEHGLSAGEATTAAFASAFELGVRAARLEMEMLDVGPIPI